MRRTLIVCLVALAACTGSHANLDPLRIDHIQAGATSLVADSSKDVSLDDLSKYLPLTAADRATLKKGGFQSAHATTFVEGKNTAYSLALSFANEAKARAGFEVVRGAARASYAAGAFSVIPAQGLGADSFGLRTGKEFVVGWVRARVVGAMRVVGDFVQPADAIAAARAADERNAAQASK
jgi:hypothetical protein